MSRMPSSWTSTNFKDINFFQSDILNPSDFPKEEFEVYSVPSFFLGKPEILIGSSIGSTKQFVQDADVLICKINPKINRVWKVSPKEKLRQIASSEWIVMRSPLMNASYLTYYFQSPSFREILSKNLTGVGGSLTRAQPKNIAAIQVPVPPLNEQKRIVEALEHQLEQVNISLEQLDDSLKQSANLPRSIFNAAIQGDLTRDWRKDRNIDKTSWTEKRGSEIFSFITSGSRGWADYYSASGALFLRIGNVQHDSIEPDLQDLIYVKLPEEIEGKRTRIHVGDILVSITADIGRIAFIKQDLGEAYINQHLCLARLNDEYQRMGEYLAYFLAAQEGGQKQFEELRRGATRAGLGLADIRNLKFLLPTYEEQLEIIRCIEEQYGFAKQLETQYKETQVRLQQTIPKLLEKAFRGELVPQDPSDEPASVLLERIRAARAEEANKPKEVKIRKPPMKKITPEVVAQIISDMPNDHFSFDELRELVATDYDTLRDCVYSLLGDKKLNQDFDQASVHFQKVKP